MANEWYVEVNGQATGPFSVRQLKAQAAAKVIKPETRVRKGRGKWYQASNVKGLLAPEANSSESPAKPSSKNPRSPAPPKAGGPAESEGIFLAPVRNRRRRAIIFGCLVAFIMIGGAPIHQQLFFLLTVGLIIGSYPLVEIKKKTIEQTLVVFFYPVYKNTLKLRDFVGLETARESRLTDSVGCLVIFIFWYWFLFRLFDHMLPWLGGNYKLILRRYDDEEVLIWQGNNTTDFEANLELLEGTGLPLG